MCNTQLLNNQLQDVLTRGSLSTAYTCMQCICVLQWMHVHTSGSKTWGSCRDCVAAPQSYSVTWYVYTCLLLTQPWRQPRFSINSGEGGGPDGVLLPLRWLSHFEAQVCNVLRNKPSISTLDPCSSPYTTGEEMGERCSVNKL